MGEYFFRILSLSFLRGDFDKVFLLPSTLETSSPTWLNSKWIVVVAADVAVAVVAVAVAVEGAGGGVVSLGGTWKDCQSFS